MRSPEKRRSVTLRTSLLIVIIAKLISATEDGQELLEQNQPDDISENAEIEKVEGQEFEEKSYPQLQSQFVPKHPPIKHHSIPIPVPLPLPVQPGHVIIPALTAQQQQQVQQQPIHGNHGPQALQGPQGNHVQNHGDLLAEGSQRQPVYHGAPPQQPVAAAQHEQHVWQEQDPHNNQFAGFPNLPGTDHWPLPQPEMPKIVHLDVKCEKNLMKVAVEFDKPFHGIIFSKGHYSFGSCVHLPAGSGRSSVFFDVSINSCGTLGNTQNGLYGYGAHSGSGTFFENTIVVQYDPQVQEIWDQARKLRCTWHDQYEKAVTFRSFPVDMLDVVRADFAGDNVGCWMQVQVGKGPWASEVSGIVKIGQTMTMVLAIKDEENKFDMMVRNCIAHDGKRAPIELVDSLGCIVRPKLMSRFTKIKNFGSSASALSYAHFQAFKFPDSMEVHFQCTIQICRYQCPEQCAHPVNPHPPQHESYIPDGYIPAGRPREERDISGYQKRVRMDNSANAQDTTEIGLNRVIRVVSAGDLAFSFHNNESVPIYYSQERLDSGIICMSTPGFAATLVVLLAILIISCLLSTFLCLRQRHLPGAGFPYDLPVIKKIDKRNKH